MMDNLFFCAEGNKVLIAKLGGHTVLVFLYLAAVWAVIRKK